MADMSPGTVVLCAAATLTGLPFKYASPAFWYAENLTDNGDIAMASGLGAAICAWLTGIFMVMREVQGTNNRVT